MKEQLTVRGFEPELAARIRQLAAKEGLSLNQVVLRLLRKATGLEKFAVPENVVGDSLDALIGTWSDAEAAELMESVSDFEQVDESLWG